MEGKNGVCSEDDVIQKLHDNISTAEGKIADIIAALSHCEVSGMSVYYNRGTSANLGEAMHFTNGMPAGVCVELKYRII